MKKQMETATEMAAQAAETAPVAQTMAEKEARAPVVLERVLAAKGIPDPGKVSAESRAAETDREMVPAVSEESQDGTAIREAVLAAQDSLRSQIIRMLYTGLILKAILFQYLR